MESRKSGRVPSCSFRMPSQMKTLFFGDGSSQYRPKKIVQVHADPAVYMVRDFLSKAELDYFDIMCTHYGPKFKASFTNTDNDDEVISEERTSKFVYLSKSQDKFVRSIERKSAELVGLSQVNVEPLQIVSYRPGQRFNLHHDAGTLLEDGSVPTMVPPRRLVTLFLYLNSMPEGEGHTEFPCMNLSVRPERNCALMFCNTTLNINEPCPLAVHCARPLSSAPRHPSKCCKKFGVNIWLTDTDLTDLAGGKTHTPMPRSLNTVLPNYRKRKRTGSLGGEAEGAVTSTSEVLGSENCTPVEGVLALAERRYKEWVTASSEALISSTSEHIDNDTIENCSGVDLKEEVNVDSNPPSPISSLSRVARKEYLATSMSLELAHAEMRNVSLIHPATGRSYISKRHDPEPAAPHCTNSVCDASTSS